MENIINKDDNKIGINYVSTLRAYIGTNTEYFIEQFKNIEESNKAKYSWIWLIGGFWFLYRKMYSYFLLSLIPFVNLILYIYLIFNSNKIYYKALCKKIEKDKLTGVDISNQDDNLNLAKKHGGTSYIGITVFLAITVLITVILYGSIIALFSSFYNYSNDTYDDLDYSEDITDEYNELVSNVYNAYYTYYSEDETIGEAFDGFFTNTEWSEDPDDGIDCVYFFGTTTAFGDKPLGAGAMFLVYNDGGIDLTKMFLGSDELDGTEILELLEIIYNN